MLKKKLKTLIEQRALNDPGKNFEILRDEQGLELLGGMDCGMLKYCQTYGGDCSTLVTCGSFT